MNVSWRPWLILIVTAFAACLQSDAILLPNCPIVPVEYFTSQLCSEDPFLSTTRKLANDSTPELACSCAPSSICICPLEGGIPVSSFDFDDWIRKQQGNSSCIDSYDDETFVEYPYEYHCRRDCVVTEWSYNPCDSSSSKCNSPGVTTRTRHSVIPANRHGTCTKEPFVQASACINRPCTNTFLVESTVLILSDEDFTLTEEMFDSVLRSSIALDPLKVHLFATENVVSSPNGRYLAPIRSPRRQDGLRWPPTVAIESEIDSRNATQLFFGVSVPNQLTQILETWFVLERAFLPFNTFHQHFFGEEYLNIRAGEIGDFKINQYKIFGFPRIFGIEAELSSDEVTVTDYFDLLVYAKNLDGQVADFADERFQVHIFLKDFDRQPSPSVFSGDSIGQLSHGRMHFTSLNIRKSGTYIFEVVVVDLYGLEHVSQTPALEVSSGNFSKLMLSQEPGVAFGGIAFRPQPIVIATDKYDNPVSVGGCDIKATLADHPLLSNATLYGNNVVALTNGTARYEDLFIDKVAHEATIRFTIVDGEENCTHNFSVTSIPFTVGTGPTHRLVLEYFPEYAHAGSHFSATLRLVDAGGNTNLDDSESFVHAILLSEFPERKEKFATTDILEKLPLLGSFTNGMEWVELNGSAIGLVQNGDKIAVDTRSDNPTNFVTVKYKSGVHPKLRLMSPWNGKSTNMVAIYRSQSALTRQVNQGRVNFDYLRVNKASSRYFMKFTSSLTANSSINGTLIGRGRKGFGLFGYGYGHGPSFAKNISDNITLITDSFDVVRGDPVQLGIVQEAGQAWHGGAPFLQQPIISILDAGGNWLDTVMEGKVTVELVVDGVPIESFDSGLIGDTGVNVLSGLAEFSSLGIMGTVSNISLKYTYFLEGQAVSSILQSELHVDSSIESWIYEDKLRGEDLFGSALAATENTLVVGAPAARSIIQSFQIIEVTSLLDDIDDVQIISSHGEFQDQTMTALMSFNTSNPPNVRMSWKGMSSSFFRSSDPLEFVENILTEELIVPLFDFGHFSVNRVETVKSETTFLEWEVTAVNIRSPVPDLWLIVENEDPIAFNLSKPAQGIKGYFRVGTQGIWSSLLPHNAFANNVREIINDLYNITGVEVTRDGDAVLGVFTWQVTFPAIFAPVPAIDVDGSKLTGRSVSIKTRRRTEGKQNFEGTFKLMMNRNGPSRPISRKTSSKKIESILQELSPVPLTVVDKETSADHRRIRWVIAFQLVPDEIAEPNMSLYAQSLSSGFNVSVIIINQTTKADLIHVSKSWPVGSIPTNGNEGAVFVYRKVTDRWVPDINDWDEALDSEEILHKLRGHDSLPGDHFGSSVSVLNDTIAAGAPFSVFDQSLEVQGIRCRASSGSFHLKWRGQITPALKSTLTPEELAKTLEQSWIATKLKIDTTSYCSSVCTDDGKGCELFLTFMWPREGDLEPIIVESNTLDSTLGIPLLQVEDNVVAGRIMSSGKNVSQRTSGSVYIFRKSEAEWTEHQKLFPPQAVIEGMTTYEPIRCGHKVVLSESASTLIVACPDENTFGRQNGGIHTYEKVSSKFQYLNSVYLGDITENFEHLHCGTDIALNHDALLVACPGNFETKGIVVFLRKNIFVNDAPWLVSQIISEESAVKFGSSISLSSQTLAVSSIGRVFLYELLLPTGSWLPIGTVSSPLDSPSFGYQIALKDRILAVSDHPCDGANFLKRVMPVQEVCIESEDEIFADSLADDRSAHDEFTNVKRLVAEKIGGMFTLWVKHPRLGFKQTSILFSNSTITNIRSAIEDELGMGRVNVSLSKKAGEHPCWQITFLESWRNYTKFSVLGKLRRGFVEPPKLHVQARLDSLSLQMTTRTISTLLPSHPSTVTIFRGTEVSQTWHWTPEAVLVPNEPQLCDGFGTSMDIVLDRLILGAKYRHRGLSGTKTGAALVADLSWLDVRFSSPELLLKVEENAEKVNIEVMKCDPSCEHFGTATETASLVFETLPGKNWVTYDKFNSIRPPIEMVQGLRTATTFQQTCKVTSDAGQCSFIEIAYSGGANLSGFDFLGLADFRPVKNDVKFGSETGRLSKCVEIMNDNIFEEPGEYFHVILSSKGMLPLIGGNYWKIIEIMEDDDGAVGITQYTERIYPEEAPKAFGEGLLSRFGSDICIVGDFAFIGAPQTSSVGNVFGGVAYMFENKVSGWTRVSIFQLSDFDAQNFSYFGAGIDAKSADSDNDVKWLAVGAPGIVSVMILRVNTSDNDTTSVLLEPWLHATQMNIPTVSRRIQPYDRFGDSRTVSIMEEKLQSAVVAVGCPGKSAVFIFSVEYDELSGTLVGNQTSIIRSPHFQEYELLEKMENFRDQFGHSVTVKDRSLYIGAPYARLDNPAPWNSHSEIDDDIANTVAKSRGAVYQYFFADCTYTTSGNPDGVWNRQKLMTLADSIGWSRALGWTNGFDSPQVIENENLQCVGIFINVRTFLDPSSQPGSKFGYSVDVSDFDLVVGSPGYCSIPQVSWNFEDGTLRGWSAQGEAFINQPTKGDNVQFRPVYPFDRSTVSYSGAADISGNFWIGTYENHTANSSNKPGTVSGDTPVGVLTSPPFLISGEYISFLIGGGCSIKSTFVQLIVDGIIEYRSTGKCDESMQRVRWQVQQYEGRTGIIQVVDFASFTPWGHINIDDFRFSWDMGKFTEVFAAGAAYAWQLENTHEHDNECIEHESNRSVACSWEFSQVFHSSDMQENAAFATSVTVDSSSKLLIIAESLISKSLLDWIPFPGNLRVFNNDPTLRRRSSYIWDKFDPIADPLIPSNWSDFGSSGWSDSGTAFSNLENTISKSQSRVLNEQEQRIVSSLKQVLMEQGYESRTDDTDIQMNSILSENNLQRNLVLSPDLIAGSLKGSPSPIPSVSPLVAPTPTGSPTVLPTAVPFRLKPSEWLDDLFAQLQKFERRDASSVKAESSRIFVFRKLSTVRGALNRFVRKAQWPSSFPSDIVSFPFYVAGDMSSSMTLRNNRLLIGHPGANAGSGWRDSGEVTFLNTQVLAPFLDMNPPNKSNEYVSNPFYNILFQDYVTGALGLRYQYFQVNENVTTGQFILPVYVHQDVDNTVNIAYATRDISARGISTEKYDHCKSLPIELRADEQCGHYEQKTGLLYFTPSRRQRHIVIRIMDDDRLTQRHREFAVHLFVPGGVVISGNQRSVTINIVDDDTG